MKTREELDALCNEYRQETRDIVDAIKAFLEAFGIEHTENGIRSYFELPIAIKQMHIIHRHHARGGRYTALARLWEIVKDVRDGE